MSDLSVFQPVTACPVCEGELFFSMHEQKLYCMNPDCEIEMSRCDCGDNWTVPQQGWCWACFAKSNEQELDDYDDDCMSFSEFLYPSECPSCGTPIRYLHRKCHICTMEQMEY